MIKKLLLFFATFTIVSLVYFIFLYGAGLFLEGKDILLYDSESDQQRNFNIVVTLWLILASSIGFAVSRRKS